MGRWALPLSFSSPAARLIWAAGIALLTAGCAVHYTDTKTGAEHLLGFGQLELKKKPAGDGLAAIVTGVRVPGLCLEVGRDHFGFSLGYLNRQTLRVVNTNATDGLEPPRVSPGVRTGGDADALWAFGLLRMRSIASPVTHHAIVTGKALAGFGAGLGNGDDGLGLALDGRQKTVLFDENIRLDFDQDAPRWPGFDLFALKVSSFTPTIPTNQGTKGEP
jgi:hypothetical protein